MGALDDHRIVSVRTRRFRTRWPRLIGKNARLGEHGYGREFLASEILTDLGASGWGVVKMVAPDRIPDITGRKLADVFTPESGVISDDALFFDIALHDLAGVVLDTPVHRMLGGSEGAVIPCYDGAIYMDDIGPDGVVREIGVVLDNCRRDHERGYRAFKLKIGRGARWMEKNAGLRRDIEITRAVRETFPSCDILVDANDGYSCEECVRYLEAVADCGLFWIEEPFRENREDLARLKEAIAKRSPSTLIADGECDPDLSLLSELATDGLIDVWLLDIMNFGFTPWRRLMPRIRELSACASPHAWDLKLKTFYAAQLGAGLGNVNTVEGVPDEIEGVDDSAYRLEEGKLSLPDRPGFGLSIEWGRVIHEHRAGFLLKSCELPLQYEPVEPRRKLSYGRAGLDYADWKVQCTRKLRELIQLSDQTSGEVRELRAHEIEGVKVRALSMAADCGVVLPAYLLSPKPTAARGAVMAIHGHSVADMSGFLGQRNDSYRSFPLRLAQEGYLVLCPFMRGFGIMRDLAEDHPRYSIGYEQSMHFPYAMDTFLRGRTVVGEHVTDLLRWETWLAGEFGIDSLAAAGLSYGGDLSLAYPAFSDRVERIFCSGASGSYALQFIRCHNGPAHCVPGILEWMERSDIAGLIAPRPLVIHYGENDKPNKKDGRITNLAAAYNEDVDECMREVEEIYAAAGASGRAQLIVTPGMGHQMDVNELLRFISSSFPD